MNELYQFFVWNILLKKNDIACYLIDELLSKNILNMEKTALNISRKNSTALSFIRHKVTLVAIAIRRIIEGPLAMHFTHQKLAFVYSTI
jgi:hypothetical protein